MKKILFLASFFLITSGIFFIFTDGVYAKEVSFEYDSNFKEGFVDQNPWENNFKDVELQEVDLNEFYNEEEALRVFEEIEEIKNAATSNESVIILKPEINNISISPLALKSKSWYRAEFTAFALYAGTLNLPTASNYLYHSLQDNPSDRINPVGSGHSNALSLTRMYTDISRPMASAIDTANRNGRTSVGNSGSTATSVANVGLDFYLTYGLISYQWGASKLSNGTWAVNIVITDVYDYQTIKKANMATSFPQKYIDLANNHAADAQSVGAIVPYDVTTVFYQNYTPR